MKVLLFLILMVGVNIFANAQNENESLFLLKGKIIYQKIKPNEIIKISFFQDNDRFYQTKINDDTSFEIKIPKGIYKVEIMADNGFVGYKFENIKIGDSENVTFDSSKSSYQTLYCPQISNDTLIQIEEAKLSTEFISKPLQELPKAQNKTKRKINKHK